MTIVEMRNAHAVADSRITSANGTSNKAAFDRWFRYPAGLSLQALERLFDPRHNPQGGAVIDPFCGAGTVGTRAAALDRRFIGVEAHPEIAELARLKLATGTLEADQVRTAVANVRLAASNGFDISGENDLVRRCFAPETLALLASMREAVKSIQGGVAPYLKWALLATLRDVANVKVGWPYLRPSLSRRPPFKDPIARFETRVNWMLADLEARDRIPLSTVLQGDSGNPDTWDDTSLELLGPATISLTSPPYLNNFDYADATRLEMYFWGRNSSWKEMVADVRQDMLVATTQQTTVSAAELALESLEHLPNTHATVESLMGRLAAERKLRKAGKSYDRVLPQYMQGITRVLVELKGQLEPGSWCGWVVGDSAPYGVYVDTPGLIQAAAEELGYVGAESEVLRDRGLRWRTNGTRHQVSLNERIIWMKTGLA